MPAKTHAGDGVGQRCQAPLSPVRWTAQDKRRDAIDPASRISAAPNQGIFEIMTAIIPTLIKTKNRGTITRLATGEIQLMRLKWHARRGSCQICTARDTTAILVSSNPAAAMPRKATERMRDAKGGRGSVISSIKSSHLVRIPRPHRCHRPG